MERHLTTRCLGSSLHCFDEIDSTNTVARERARDGAAEGTAVIAESQTRGRGRLGRSWVSPPGLNLYLSIVLRPGDRVDRLSVLSLVAGVAACEAVREYEPRAVIKWPNDLLVEGRKVAGILTEVEGEGERQFAVVGIGVNLNSTAGDFPDELGEVASSLLMTTGSPIDRPQFAAALLGHLEHAYDRLRAEGFGPIREEWLANSCLAGRRVAVAGVDRDLAGVVVGLDEDGALRVQLEDGSEERVVAGDVTVEGGI